MISDEIKRSKTGKELSWDYYVASDLFKAAPIPINELASHQLYRMEPIPINDVDPVVWRNIKSVGTPFKRSRQETRRLQYLNEEALKYWREHPDRVEDMDEDNIQTAEDDKYASIIRGFHQQLAPELAARMTQYFQDNVILDRLKRQGLFSTVRKGAYVADPENLRNQKVPVDGSKPADVHRLPGFDEQQAQIQQSQQQQLQQGQNLAKEAMANLQAATALVDKYKNSSHRVTGNKQNKQTTMLKTDGSLNNEKAPDSDLVLKTVPPVVKVNPKPEPEPKTEPKVQKPPRKTRRSAAREKEVPVEGSPAIETGVSSLPVETEKPAPTNTQSLPEAQPPPIPVNEVKTAAETPTVGVIPVKPPSPKTVVTTVPPPLVKTMETDSDDDGESIVFVDLNNKPLAILIDEDERAKEKTPDTAPVTKTEPEPEPEPEPEKPPQKGVWGRLGDAVNAVGDAVNAVGTTMKTAATKTFVGVTPETIAYDFRVEKDKEPDVFARRMLIAHLLHKMIKLADTPTQFTNMTKRYVPKEGNIFKGAPEALKFFEDPENITLLEETLEKYGESDFSLLGKFLDAKCSQGGGGAMKKTFEILKDIIKPIGKIRYKGIYD